MVGLWLGTAWAGAECPSTASSVDARLASSIAAYEALDLTGFAEQAQASTQAAECAGDVLGPATVAQLHLVHGLASWVAKDEASALSSFQASRAALPTVSLPTSVAPAGSRLREAWEGLAPRPSEDVGLDVSRAFLVDALPSKLVPRDHATFVQEPSASQGWYLSRGASDPLAVAVLPPPPAPVPPGGRAARSDSAPWWTAAGASGAGLVASVITAWATERSFLDGATPQRPMKGTFVANQVATVGEPILGATTIAFVAVAWGHRGS